MCQASLPEPPSGAFLQAVAQSVRSLRQRQARAAAERLKLMASVNAQRCRQRPLLGADIRRAVHVELPTADVHLIKEQVASLISHIIPIAHPAFSERYGQS